MDLSALAFRGPPFKLLTRDRNPPPVFWEVDGGMSVPSPVTRLSRRSPNPRLGGLLGALALQVFSGSTIVILSFLLSSPLLNSLKKGFVSLTLEPPGVRSSGEYMPSGLVMRPEGP